ncbi:putative transposon TX1 [Toxocara canis]|uniref:Putative transposon TX1 n=1 Tax=Toxocara canis TaxID=6265 RepID=A0A0B2VRC9_TOXCA|nr:putative transposon TX1 [Toxocara canis]
MEQTGLAQTVMEHFGLSQAAVEQVELFEGVMEHFGLGEAVVEQAELDEAIMGASGFRQAVVKEAELDEPVMERSGLGQAVVKKAELDEAIMGASGFRQAVKTPAKWKESKTILLHEKGDEESLHNYRPISLLSQVYKLFMKVISNRLSFQIDEQQPREQAGFRRNFSVEDHLFTINQILEKCNENKLPLCIASVDYEKAFDSVEINAVLQALVDQGISSEYVSLLKEANSGCSTEITLFDRAVRIPRRR